MFLGKSCQPFLTGATKIKTDPTADARWFAQCEPKNRREGRGLRGGCQHAGKIFTGWIEFVADQVLESP